MATRSGTQARRNAISAGMLKITEVWRETALSKLVEAFTNDMDVPDACVYAGIGERTYYRWISRWPELRQRFERAQLNPVMIASNKVMTGIASDPRLAFEFLKVRRKERYTAVNKTEAIVTAKVEGETEPGLENDLRDATLKVLGERAKNANPNQ